jgi:hypothetical protein
MSLSVLLPVNLLSASQSLKIIVYDLAQQRIQVASRTAVIVCVVHALALDSALSLSLAEIQLGQQLAEPPNGASVPFARRPRIDFQCLGCLVVGQSFDVTQKQDLAIRFSHLLDGTADKFGSLFCRAI